MAATRTPGPAWPSGPAEGYYQDDYAVQDQTVPHQALSEQGQALGVITELAALLRDARVNLAISAGTLASITIGVALEAAFSLGRCGPARSASSTSPCCAACSRAGRGRCSCCSRRAGRWSTP